MKKLKLLWYILFVFILIFSLMLNVLLLNSTYGTLVFKYDEGRLKSMILSDIQTRFNGFSENDITSINRNNFNLSIGEGLFLKYSSKKPNEEKETYEYHIYLDENDGFTYYYKSKSANDSETERHYVGQTLYTNTNGIKIKTPLTTESDISKHENGAIDKFISFYKTPLSLLLDQNFKSKTSLDFSISPFYVFGIKVSFEFEKSIYNLSYDLSGNLRKITQKNENGIESTTQISAKNKKLEFPNLDKYVIEK